MRLRRLAVLLGCSVPVLAVTVATGGCFPDPKGDFDEYNERTGEFRTVPSGDGGAFTDSAPPTEAVEALYYGVCLSQLAAGRPDRVLRFYTQTKFTPDATGGTGKLEMTLTPMKLGEGNTAPGAVSKEWLTGSPYNVSTTTNAPGVYAATLGTVNIPGNANPISGRDIIVENAALPGKFAKDRFCSQLSGHVVQPTDIQLEPNANTCLYIQVKEGDVPPAVKGSDFPASCVLQ